MPADLKLLFDESLSKRLIRMLSDAFPDSTHIEQLGLLGASDLTVWTRAGTDAFILVTRDEDFHRLSVLYGPPPKVVWLRRGNCSMQEVAQILVASLDAIRAFAAHDDAAFLTLE